MKRGRKPSVEKIERIIRLYETGMTLAEVASEAGVTRQYVSLVLKHNGIDPREIRKEVLEIVAADIAKRRDGGESISSHEAHLLCRHNRPVRAKCAACGDDLGRTRWSNNGTLTWCSACFEIRRAASLYLLVRRLYPQSSPLESWTRGRCFACGGDGIRADSWMCHKHRHKAVKTIVWQSKSPHFQAAIAAIERSRERRKHAH